MISWVSQHVTSIVDYCIIIHLYKQFVVVFTKQPKSNGLITRAEGSDVVLGCEATGHGVQNLMYEWKRVMKVLPSNVRRSNGGRNLTIISITKDDEGQYYCEISYKGNKVSSMKVQVSVKSKLLIQLSSSQVFYIQLNANRETISQ